MILSTSTIGFRGGDAVVSGLVGWITPGAVIIPAFGVGSVVFTAEDLDFALLAFCPPVSGITAETLAEFWAVNAPEYAARVADLLFEADTAPSLIAQTTDIGAPSLLIDFTAAIVVDLVESDVPSLEAETLNTELDEPVGGRNE